MAKKISSLSGGLNGTTGPFVKAFGGATSTLTGFASRAASAGKSMLKLTGLGAGLAVAMKAVNAILAAPGQAMDAAKRQIDAETKLQAVLLATGHAAGFSADQLKQHAADLQKATTFGDEAVIEFQSVLATFKNVSGDAFRGATEAALDMAAVMGQDLKTTAVQLGKALNDPTRGIAALRRVGVSFTAQQMEQIKAMQAAGDIAGAQAVILKELQGEFGGAAAAMAKTPFGRMTQVWNAFGDTMEQVAMVMADIAVGIFQAFNIDGAISSFSSALSVAQAAVKGWIPVAVSAFQRLSAIVSGAFTRIYALVAPIVQAIGDFIARNWQSALATTTGVWVAVYGIIKTVAGVVWSTVQTLWSGVVAVWTWAMDLLGVKTAQTGSTVGNVFQTLVEWGQWLQRGITLALNVAGYAITHWRDLVEMAGVNVLLSLARIGNQVEYVFTEVIPSLLTWFADNWAEIFTDIANFNATVFTNMAKNVGNFFAAVWGAMKGDGFTFEWTALTEGFEATLQELPKIAERQMGPIEAGLQREADRLGASFSKGLGEYLAEQDAVAKGLADGITGAGGSLADALKFEAPAAPGVTPFAPISTALDDVTAKANEAKAALGAVVSGSAQGQLLKYQAGLKFTAKAAPISSTARKDMAEGGKQTALTKQLVDLTRQGNQTLADIVDGEADAEGMVEVAF